MQKFLYKLLLFLLCGIPNQAITSTVASFESEASWSFELVSAVSLVDGSDRMAAIETGWWGDTDIGYDWTAGAEISRFFGPVDVGHGLYANGIDDTADEAAEYGIVAGEYPNDTFAYRSECTGGTPLSPEPASCAGDGVEMTFKYSAEAFARVQLPDSLGVHEASASAGGGVTAFIADFGYSIYDWFSGFETNNFLVGGAGANVSLSGFDRQESDYQKVSGFITVNVSAGEAVYTRQTGYANGRAYLASPPTPVPVPASFVLLCGGIAALFPLAGLRRRPPA